MDFALDAQQDALARAAAELLDGRFDDQAARDLYDDPDSPDHLDKLWSEIAQQGWLAITVEPDYDGLGLGLVEAQLIARELGAHTAPGPWHTGTLSVQAIGRAGDADQRRRWLPALAGGTSIGTCVLDQPIRGDGATAHGRLRGVEYADVATLLVGHDETGQLGVVDLAGPGVRLHRQSCYDASCRLYAVDLDAAPFTPLTGGDRRVLGELRHRAAVLAAADLVGIARHSLRRTVSYDQQRVQFGRPVGSFQALKHALADLHTCVSMAEHAVLYAAHALDASLPDAELAVAVAKSKANTAATAATAAYIQFSGGIGFTWEHEAHHYYKRAKRLVASHGDTAAHRETIARLLLDRAGEEHGA